MLPEWPEFGLDFLAWILPRKSVLPLEDNISGTLWPIFLLLIYLESTLQDENFESCWRSVRPSVQNSKICHAVKRPKAIGLDRPQGPEQCFITCLTISQEKSRIFIALFPTVWATDKKMHDLCMWRSLVPHSCHSRAWTLHAGGRQFGLMNASS